MLLADILARDACSIAVDTSEGQPEPRIMNADSGSSALVAKELEEWYNSPFKNLSKSTDSEIRYISQFTKMTLSSVKKKRRLSIRDIPDDIIERIIKFHLVEAGNTTGLRLVSKRISVLALPIVLHTVSAKTINALSHLVSVPLSPFYLERLGKHIFSFEIAFSILDFELPGFRLDTPLAVPNLDIVRFRFTSGVRCSADRKALALISEDTLCRSVESVKTHYLMRFLSQLRPKRLEWLSGDSKELYFLGIPAKLRVLFESWKSLTTVYLDGICIVEQPDLGTWAPVFVAERVHVKGLSTADSTFLASGLANLKASTPCRYLLLESTEPHSGHVSPIINFGSTMIALKGWKVSVRQSFVDKLTKQPRSLQAEKSSSATHVRENVRYAKFCFPVKSVAIQILVTPIAAMMVLSTLLTWHVPEVSRHCNASRDIGLCRGSSLYDNVPSQFSGSVFRGARRPSELHKGFSTFVPT